ncbi:hypothetical protein GGR56DRAFT_636382 [Xylariaceae sp. FL0804]|nr:hypothetical protein GGR56DRAFT_636382 [Xylariaceae sp. FL0804]
MVKWGHKNKVSVNGFHMEFDGYAAMWMCNCKDFFQDPAPEDEIANALNLIDAHCGYLKPGWVYSSPWHKGWNVGRTDHDICPSGCYL